MPERDIGVETLPRLRQSKRRELWAVLVRCILVLTLGLLPMALCLKKVNAAAGDLDPAFGSGGKTTTNFFGRDDFASGVAIQPDGKMIVAGAALVSDAAADFALARYNTDGSLDPTFGVGGKVTTDFFADIDLALGVVLQPSDGKIIAVGTAVKPLADHYETYFALARYETNGTLDSTFGSGGKVTTDVLNINIHQSASVIFVQAATAVRIQNDNKIVVAGGLIDVEAAPGVTPAPLGNFGLARYNINGTLDTSFGAGGKTGYGFFERNDTATSLALQADGKIVAAGFATKNTGNLDEDFACVRFNSDGSSDNSFGSNGAITTDFVGGNDDANAVVIQLDGKIILGGFADRTSAGGSPDMALVRYNVDGTLDNSFGTGGKVFVDYSGQADAIYGLALQIDGKIVAAGGAGNASNIPDFALARFSSGGVLDQSFGTSGKVTTDFFGGEDFVTGIAIQADSKIVAAGAAGNTGNSDFAVARYLNPDVGPMPTPTPTPAPTPTPTPTPTPRPATVTGRVLENNTPLEGVLVTLSSQSGTILQSTMTGTDGRWTFTGVVIGGSYSISFTKQGYAFSPPGLAFSVVQDPQDMGDVVAMKGTFIQFNASSYFEFEGTPRVILTVNRTGDTSGASTVNYSTIDDAGLQECKTINGTASPRCDYINTMGTLTWAAGDATAKSFSVAVVDDGYAEGNETFRVSLSNPIGGSLLGEATVSVTIADNEIVNQPNPIDNTNFFVRQQYIDFLGREPDPLGFSGWTSTINNCSVDHPGHPEECDRVHVSQLFFQSDEFQSRGYFVYRFYPVAFGRKPFYAEFVPDLAAVSGFLTPTELEAAKAKFAVDFAARPAFLSVYNYPSTPTGNQQYVDALLNTAGVTLSASARQALIDGLNGGTLSRGQVLRQIVDSSEVQSKYFNQAYAVMEYSGYLRREPDIFYLDWINVLNTTGDARGMVTGFVNSIEYRQRFGPP